MKMTPSATRSTTAAILRIPSFEKAIDITTEQAVVSEIRPWLLFQLVRDQQGWRLINRDLGPTVHIPLYVGQYRRIFGQRLHLFLFLWGQSAGNTLPNLAARAPRLLATEQRIAHGLILA